MAKLTSWSEFRDAVEGRAGARPIAIVDGLPVRVEGPPPRKPAPNLQLLSALLRGGAPLPRAMRAWLADLFDSEADSTMRIPGLVKRHPGPMPGPVLPHSSAVDTFKAVWGGGVTRQQALHAAGKKHGLSKTTLEKAIADQDAAEEDHARAARDE